MSVLVDTSVWIRFLAGRAPFVSGLSRLLEAEEVIAHELVFGELLIGDRSGRARLLSDYALLPKAGTVPHEDLVPFVRARKLMGRGAGWIDVHLLASALVDRARLWTADPRLHALAEELGVEYADAAH